VKSSDRFLNTSVAAPPTEGLEETGGHVSADKPNPDDTNARRGLPAAPGREAPAAVPGDDELVRRARSDEPRAIAQLVERYQKKVYAIAYQFCGFDKSEAQDMAQEALLQIFRNLKRFEGRSQFSTWLYRVAVNACLDARRRQRRWSHIFFPWRAGRPDGDASATVIEDLPSPEEEGNPLSNVSGGELKRDVMAALDTLSANQRIVFQLKVFQDMRIPEIAAVTGMAEGTVKTHLFRATRAVRTQMRGWVAP
jgi:RNA polymerase sigma-70 factor (ECF subfamily)